MRWRVSGIKEIDGSYNFAPDQLGSPSYPCKRDVRFEVLVDARSLEIALLKIRARYKVVEFVSVSKELEEDIELIS